MSANAKILTLKSEIIKGTNVLDRISEFYEQYIDATFDPGARRIDQAIVIADLICSYYTCLETIFFRISQFFENDLSKEKWHQDLLEKMTLNIEGVRTAVISGSTHQMLLELLKFRHFKRYYFELNYDWDKLEFIQKKFVQAVENVKRDLSAFLKFIDQL
ncbi:hypothetical protein JXJ21_05580 [candidate division KSB1 bacterium]|nr:hypothetical protein [candidate division KSB1 bacterium]